MVVFEKEVKTLEQHPEHRKMLGFPIVTEMELSSLDEAYERKKKLLPVLFVLVMEGNIEKNYVIDGWSSVLSYRAKGIETIPAIKVDLDSPDELPYLLADLHTNYHNSPRQDFEKFTYFSNLLGLGQGYRSDLLEDKKAETEVSEEKAEKERNATIVEKIAKLFGKSSSYVKHILKIGKVNPEYFELITNEKFSVFGAYSACIAEARGELPSVPKVKTPVYYTSSTEVPTYTTFNSTVEQNEEEVERTTATFSQPSTTVSAIKPVVVANSNTVAPDETEYIVVTGICECCGEETNLKINKNQIK